jgi:hypothetical protein
VHHLPRPSKASTAPGWHVDVVARASGGAVLVTAIGAAQPLDLGSRAQVEPASAYLADLLPRLRSAATAPIADLTMVSVRPAEIIAPRPRPPEPPAVKPRAPEPVANKPAPRPQALRSGRCSNIISRAQLGETLSNDELTGLRTECRS